ncbi:hypothetical protein GTW43_02805 [Streptomyces sp. SID5785]|nr:hypothetical protein [Streptomyces sp. SID5785]
MDVPPFVRPSLVKAVFREVTSLPVSRQAAWAAASVTRTVLSRIIEGATAAARDERRTKLVPSDLVTAIDRNVEVEVGTRWYACSPTFRGLTGVVHDAQGRVVPPPRRRRSRRPGAVTGTHRFEPGVRELLRSHGTSAVPAMTRDLNGIASAFLTDLAGSAAMVVREGGIKRFGYVTLGTPEAADPTPSLTDPPPAAQFAHRTAGPVVGAEDILAAVTMQLFGDIREQALIEARQASGTPSAR